MWGLFYLHMCTCKHEYCSRACVAACMYNMYMYTCAMCTYSLHMHSVIREVFVHVYVIGWSTVVFGINGASNAVRKYEIVRGEAECYVTLPDCIASAIIPKYHSIDHPITN